MKENLQTNITEYNASFSPTNLSGQKAWTRNEFISLTITVQIFEITDLFLRKISSQENAKKCRNLQTR